MPVTLGARIESPWRKEGQHIVRTSLRSFGVLGAVALAALPAPGSVFGQDVDVAAVMRCYEKEVMRSELEPSARSPLDCGTPTHYLTPGAYPPATVEAVLDGLVDLAMTSTSRDVRVGAVGLIGHFGGYRPPEGVIDVYRPSQVDRLSRLLSERSPWEVQRAAMGVLPWQPDKAGAAGALAGVLTRPAPAGRLQAPLHTRALDLLAVMGPEGTSELGRLLAEDAIPTPGIRARVSAVVERPPR